MKKTLVALAALAATVAYAQSSVTIYGIADVAWVTKTHTAGNGTTLSKTSGIGDGFMAGNRIGFRGTEDLGGGLKAGFNIEQGINLTNGALFSSRAAAGGQQYDGISTSTSMPAGAYSTATNRQSFVSLGGGFGEVRAGYQYTALYTVSTLSGYFFGAEQPGGDMSHGTFENANYGGTRANGLTYISPKIAGAWQVTVQHGAGTGRETAEFSANTANGKTKDNVKRDSFLVNYANGPLNASFAHTTVKTQANAVAANATQAVTGILGVTAISTASAAAVDAKATLNQLAGSYDFGVAKLGALYTKGDRTDAGPATPTNVTNKSVNYGVQAPLGATTVFAQWGTSKTTNNVSGATTFDGRNTQFGAKYSFSKRTTGYIYTGSVKDNVATNAAAATIAKRQATAIGLNHTF